MAGDNNIFCDGCGKKFQTKDSMEQHKRDAHTHESVKKKNNRKVPKGWIVGILAIVIIAAGTALILPSTKAQSVIDDVQCNSMEQAVFHIHAHLDIFSDGQQNDVPSGIGIPGNCFYWLHTHDTSGIIHIEAPVQKIFTLGQFINIWEKSAVDKMPAGTPTAYVNGKQASGSYKDIPLVAHDEIVLVYGSPPITIPSTYNFPQGL